MSNPFADLPTNVFVQRTEPQTPATTVTYDPPTVATPVSASSENIDSVEAAEILGVTVNNLRQIVFKKQLVPSGKKGRRLTFNRADVIALAERRKK